MSLHPDDNLTDEDHGGILRPILAAIDAVTAANDRRRARRRARRPVDTIPLGEGADGMVAYFGGRWFAWDAGQWQALEAAPKWWDDGATGPTPCICPPWPAMTVVDGCPSHDPTP